MSTNYPNPYAVRWAKFSDGERMPFLVSTETGIPLDAPTFWIVGNRRAIGMQANTCANELRSLMYLYLWADARAIDVSARLQDAVFFSLSEITDLANFCGRFTDDVLEELSRRQGNVIRLPNRKHAVVRNVVSDEKRNRLSAIRSFIEFTSADLLSNLQSLPARWAHYEAVRSATLELLKGHIKGLRRRRSTDDGAAPEGIGSEAVERLEEVVRPSHPENPFAEVVRFRNYVMIRLFYELGIRRGELLNLKVMDCDLGSKGGSMHVHRRPDDPEDPRLVKPGSKTAARRLPLTDRTAELVHTWIVQHRAKIPAARRHPFLFVSKTGEPLSLSSVNFIFQTLRRKVPGIPERLTPHVMRHQWNDDFSELMDRQGVPAEKEVKYRKRLMGWKNENSANAYLRRTVRRRSDEFLLKLHEGLAIQGPEDDQ